MMAGRHTGAGVRNIEGRKRREGVRWWRGVDYGDLSAVDGCLNGVEPLRRAG